MLARHVVEVQARMNAIRNPDAKEGIVAAYIRTIDSALDPELGKVRYWATCLMTEDVLIPMIRVMQVLAIYLIIRYFTALFLKLSN